jgi:hypothetical protein
VYLMLRRQAKRFDDDLNKRLEPPKQDYRF